VSTCAGIGERAPAGYRAARHFHSAAGVPIVVQGNLWGVLLVLASQEHQLGADDATRTAGFTELVGLAIGNLQARADLAAASARVVGASDEARRKVERDLHDGTQQQLIGLLLDLRRFEEDIPARPAAVAEQLGAISTALTGAIDDLREISHGIHPAILTQRGLESALKTLARRSPIPVESQVQVPTRLPPTVETSAYYIVAEALTNATKHAHASHLYIAASVNDRSLHLYVRDDGIGGADPNNGSGLAGLTDRVTALGGTIQLTSPPNHGTSLDVTIPLDTPDPAGPGHREIAT
jgi:signal transduction histidine kinase